MGGGPVPDEHGGNDPGVPAYCKGGQLRPLDNAPDEPCMLLLVDV
jgi:hypothetical protein